MPAEVTVAELQRADILLSRGQSALSELIARADCGKYSHGALWSGKGIIQATSRGITHTPPEGEHDVYRYRGLDDAGADEVVARALDQCAGRYAYAELVLLAVLFSVGVRVRGALLSRMLDALGGPKALELKAWLEKSAQWGKTRVCTELVASCFYQTKDKRFAIQVSPFAMRRRELEELELPPLLPEEPGAGMPTRGQAREPEPSPDELAEASATCLELLERSGWSHSASVRGAALAELEPVDSAASSSTRKVFAEAIAIDAISGAPIGVVTPGDLQYSPSLEFIGHFRA